MRFLSFTILLAFLLTPLAGLADTHGPTNPDDDARLDAYIDFLRQEIKDGKTKLITQNMQLTAGEAAAFWPLYDAYQAQRKQLGNKRLKLLKDYAQAKNGGLLDEEAATDLLARTLAWEEERVVLIRNYATQISAAISAERAAQFYQIETRVDAVVEVGMAADVPLLELSNPAAADPAG